MTAAIVIQSIVIAFIPLAAMALARRYRAARAIGPVLICYGLGLVMGNQPLFAVQTDAAQAMSALGIALAIVLMVVTLDLASWMRLARSTLISFGLAVLAVLVVAAAAGLLFSGRVPQSAEIAGMLVGVYTGGTPNMAAIGFALGVTSETFGMLNVADMMLGTVYVMFLFWGAKKVFGRLLPPFVPRRAASSSDEQAAASGRLTWRSAGISMALAIAIIALSGLVYAVAPRGFEMPFAILSITTLAIAGSLIRRVRCLGGAYGLGQYFLLVFCVAIGAQADFGQLVAASPLIFLFVSLVMVGAIVLHLVLAALFRIDTDTMIITSVAGIFGPAFVVPVAEAIGNREIVLSGITTGLIGYAVANYLGLGLAWLLG